MIQYLYLPVYYKDTVWKNQQKMSKFGHLWKIETPCTVCTRGTLLNNGIVADANGRANGLSILHPLDIVSSEGSVLGKQAEIFYF